MSRCDTAAAKRSVCVRAKSSVRGDAAGGSGIRDRVAPMAARRAVRRSVSSDPLRSDDTGGEYDYRFDGNW